MELPSQEADEMPIPLNTTYGGVSHGHHHHHPHSHGHGHAHGHMIHHDHASHNHSIIPPPLAAVSSAPPSNGPTISDDHDEDVDEHGHHNDHHQHHVSTPFKKMVRYRECLKNHAASMGGNATDGCGEFMPSGEEGTIEALTCSACNCHRNFHRKEIEGEPSNSCDITNCFHNNFNPRMGRKYFMGHHHKGYLGPAEAIAYHAGPLIPSRAAHHVAPHQMIMSYGGGGLPSESDDQEEGGGGGGGGMMMRPHKKRFRTKFTQEQKEKMLSFAEKVGWKIQKQEETVVQQFCQEVGVKRRVLKVWMHNNKHSLAKKNLQSNPQNQV